MGSISNAVKNVSNFNSKIFVKKFNTQVKCLNHFNVPKGFSQCKDIGREMLHMDINKTALDDGLMLLASS